MQLATLDIRTYESPVRYISQMGKRTSLILDSALLQEAAGVLGTKGPTATVREALARVVRQEHLDRLARWRLPEDFPEQLERMRQPRMFDLD